MFSMRTPRGILKSRWSQPLPGVSGSWGGDGDSVPVGSECPECSMRMIFFTLSHPHPNTEHTTTARHGLFTTPTSVAARQAPRRPFASASGRDCLLDGNKHIVAAYPVNSPVDCSPESFPPMRYLAWQQLSSPKASGCIQSSPQKRCGQQ